MKSIKAMPTVSARRYQNPLPVESASGLQAQPDPFVLKYNGEYYGYSTLGSGIPVMHSKDLVNWRHLGYALVMPGHKQFWAPCAIYYNGLFYLYYSCMEQDATDVHTQSLKVAVSTKPEGPFAYVKTFYTHFSIDPHVISDEQGEWWMYYTVSRFAGIDGNRPGTVNVVDRMLDPYTLEGNPQPVIEPTIAEEIFEKNRFGDGRDWYCVEGSFHLKRGDKEYVMFSGNAFTHEDYFLGYAVKSPDGQWEKYPDAHTYHPVLRRSETVEGTGHHSVAFAPNNVDRWVVYHGRNVIAEGAKGERRNMRMDPLLWAGDRMWVPGPTDSLQDAPHLPAFRDLFDGADGFALSAAWRVLAGEWKQQAGEARQESVAGPAAAVTEAFYSSYILEANLKAEESFMGAEYGVYALYRDADNLVAVQLDAGKRRLSLYEKVNGLKHGETSVPLPQDFAFNHYHELRVVKTGCLYQVSIDGRPLASATFHQDRGAVGLYSRFTQACFDGIAVTEHLELTRETARAFAGMVRVLEGPWELREGRLLCGNPDPGGKALLLLSEKLPEHFVLTADLDLSLCSKRGRSGIYPIYQSEDNHIQVSFDSKARTVRLEVVRAGSVDVQAEVELPSEILQLRVHTFYVKKDAGKLIVLFDEVLVYAGDAGFADGQAGLFSQGESGFCGLRLTGLGEAPRG